MADKAGFHFTFPLQLILNSLDPLTCVRNLNWIVEAHYHTKLNKDKKITVNKLGIKEGRDNEQ